MRLIVISMPSGPIEPAGDIQDETNAEKNYKGYYTYIFMFFYFMQGLHQAIPQFAPYYIIYIGFAEYDYAALIFISSINSLPWAFKFIVGLLNDKYALSKRFGRRFPCVQKESAERLEIWADRSSIRWKHNRREKNVQPKPKEFRQRFAALIP